MLIAGLSSIVINMNPLIKLDGYFALVDYLEVPNLSDDSAKFVTALVRRYIFRGSVEIPRHPPGLRRILFIYGVLSFCYKMFILTLTLLFFNRQIGRLFPEMGVFIFPLVAYRLLKKKLKPLWNGVHHLFVDKREVLMKSKSMAVWVVALAVVLGLFILLPLPSSQHSTFVIEPAERVPVRAATEGFIGAVFVKEGDNVRRGALLAAMRNTDLEQNRDSLRSQISVLDRNIRVQSAEDATAQSLESQRRRAQLSEQLAETETRLAQLSITAPADGVMVSRKIEDKVGVMLRQGDEFCEIAGTGAPQARVRVDDWDLRNVEIGARASLWLNAAPGQEINGRVSKLAAASELRQRLSPTSEEGSERQNAGAGGVPMDKITTGRPAEASRKQSTREQEEAAADKATSPFAAPLTRFDVLIDVEANLADLKPGMSGEAKIYGPKRPLAVTVWRGVRDWFRSKIWW
jgi:multidrug resistance efflux pump